MGSRVWVRSAPRVTLLALAIAAAAQTHAPARAQSDPAAAARPDGAPSGDAGDGIRAVADPEVPAGTELERLRAEVQRLATAQRDLARQVEEHSLRLAGQQPVEPSPESGMSLSPFLFVLGGMAGWAISRLVQRRRDRGARSRLRL